MTSIPETVRQQVWAEANYRCEYCRTSAWVIGMPLVIDRINPQSASGGNERENLAASRCRCNEFKGARTHGIYPVTGELVPLFNPRLQIWVEHFTWLNGSTDVVGLTSTGCAKNFTQLLCYDF